MGYGLDYDGFGRNLKDIYTGWLPDKHFFSQTGTGNNIVLFLNEFVMRILNVIICGAPGCGKGTQSALIVEKYNLKHLSTERLLRSEIQSNSELGKEADSYISKNLVPDSMIIDILIKAIDAGSRRKRHHSRRISTYSGSGSSGDEGCRSR